MLFSVVSILGGMIFMIVRSCRQLEARQGIASVRSN
jgi:hypothetical protein